MFYSCRLIPTSVTVSVHVRWWFVEDIMQDLHVLWNIIRLEIPDFALL